MKRTPVWTEIKGPLFTLSCVNSLAIGCTQHVAAARQSYDAGFTLISIYNFTQLSTTFARVVRDHFWNNFWGHFRSQKRQLNRHPGSYWMHGETVHWKIHCTRNCFAQSSINVQNTVHSLKSAQRELQGQQKNILSFCNFEKLRLISRFPL